MSNFVHRWERSVELPLGCKDLIDVEGIRNWKPHTPPEWTQATDRLGYIEGYLARLLQLASTPKVVGVSRSLDKGHVMVISDPSLVGSVLFASWHNAAQERTLRGVFEEVGIPPVAELGGRWKSKHSLNYPLPAESSAAARFIGEVFRAGYGLGDLSVIDLSYHERKVA